MTRSGLSAGWRVASVTSHNPLAVRAIRSPRRRVKSSAGPGLLAASGLRRQPHAARPDQARIGRLETPDGSADGPFHVDILVVWTSKRKVRTCDIAIRQRHITEDHAARIIFDDSADAEHGPKVAVHIIVDTVRTAVAGIVAAGSRAAERRVRRIADASLASRRRSPQEPVIHDPVGCKVADRKRVVIWRHR